MHIAVSNASPPSHAPAIDVLPRSNAATSRDTLDLYAKVLQSGSLETAAHTLVAALAAIEGFDRATLGWHEDGRTRLLASSHLDPAKVPADLAQALTAAMDEGIEQSSSLQWPVPGIAAGGLGRPIRLEHEAWHRLAGGAVATVPMGHGGAAFAALCVERAADAPFSSADLARLEQLMALAGPALRWMRYGSESTPRRLRRDLARAWHRLRQPDRRTTRRLTAVGLLAGLLLAAAPLQRSVDGRARVEGETQRVLVAPADGFIKATHVRPGDRVAVGQVLIDLLDGDLRLEHERWSSQLAQHENAYAAAMAKADRTAAATSLARITEAQSQLALIDEQLIRGRVTAPFDALVIQGDLSQSIGAPVHQGDTLLTLATTGRQRVVVEVDETDIARVQPGQTALLSLSSLPWQRQPLIVERITPLAKAVDGRNVFEVEARVLALHPDIRPGLLGRAEIVVGRMPPLWAWLGHVRDRARVAWWAWLG
ncbi:MAG: HlyD family efflux transporter periplasmic adaptor subunit [Vitreoscilla sp.]|nr:HlyD family efflux transporter periplasmic adaptor subunit [Vitreoscilla sp.]